MFCRSFETKGGAQLSISLPFNFAKYMQAGRINRDRPTDCPLSTLLNTGRLAIIPASVIPKNCARVSDVDVDIKGSWLAWLYQLIVGKWK